MKFIPILLIILFSATKSVAQKDFKLGEIALSNTKYDSSIYYFTSALYLSQIDTVKAQILLKRGKSFQLNQDYNRALEDFNLGLKLYKNENNVNGFVLATIFKSEFYRNLGKLEDAQTSILKIKPLIENKSIGAKTKAQFYNRYAAIIAETGLEGEQGIVTNSNRSIEISRKYGFKTIEASSLNQLAFLQFNHKNKSAVDLYLQALEIYKSLNDERSQVHVYSNLARFYQVTEEYEKGLHYCNIGIELIKNNKWYREILELYDLKSTCLHYLGRFEEAYIISIDRMNANSNFLMSVNDKNLKELEIKYEVTSKNKQIELEKAKADTYKSESKQKEKEVQTYIIITILLTMILLIGVFSYYKIRKSNERLNKSIHQKEILLQEVHHRVKNNLTVLNSLLYIQANETENTETKQILNECQSRIQSMALVHQNLYDVDDASEVNLLQFINHLILKSQEIFGSKTTVNSKIEVSNIHFDMNFTIFIGLIINELLTNSLKYAFDVDQENLIKITLLKNKENYTLIYSDSGKGLPDNFDMTNSKGFGFKLIRIMVNQIHGNIDYSNNNNSFTIQFKKTAKV